MTSCQSAQNSGTKAKFLPDTEKNLNGLHIKLSNTYILAGRTTPIFMSISGLTESELPRSPNPNGLLLLEIPGLCIGSSNMRPGYVLFMQGERWIDDACYRIY